MECPDCEKWYWAGSAIEVPLLFAACESAFFNARVCYPEIREAVLAGGFNFSRRRRTEFNFLCSRCRHRNFRPLAETALLTW
jgi:hypothetical protein